MLQNLAFNLLLRKKAINLVSIILVYRKKTKTRFKNHHYVGKNWGAHSCHLKRFKWQHLTLAMRLVCAKSSHSGWITDIMKEGKWVTASCLLMNIGATWLSSAASVMHHNLHQLLGSSWPAPSGWCNPTWHPAIKHHHQHMESWTHLSATDAEKGQ